MKKYESGREEGRKKWLCSQCFQCSQCSQSAVEYLRLFQLPLNRTAALPLRFTASPTFSFFALASPSSFFFSSFASRTSQEVQSTLTELQIRYAFTNYADFVRANSADLLFSGHDTFLLESELYSAIIFDVF